jgi:hypothetical protein
VWDACVDEGADAVWDGKPVDEDHAAPLAERERPRRAAGVELERPSCLEPGRGCLWLALAVGCDRLSRYKKQRGGERAGIDAGSAGAHGRDTCKPVERVPRAAAPSAASDGDHRGVLAAADRQRVGACGRCFEGPES